MQLLRPGEMRKTFAKYKKHFHHLCVNLQNILSVPPVGKLSLALHLAHG